MDPILAAFSRFDAVRVCNVEVSDPFVGYLPRIGLPIGEFMTVSPEDSVAEVLVRAFRVMERQIPLLPLSMKKNGTQWTRDQTIRCLTQVGLLMGRTRSTEILNSIACFEAVSGTLLAQLDAVVY